MKKKNIKWGILATGGIAHKFAHHFQRVSHAEIIAVGSRSLTRAKKFATEFNILRAYGSYEALVKDKDIDAIYVATPHNLHKDNTLMALNAGKAVLCEKPLSLNQKEVLQMQKLAMQKKLLLMEALWARFNPAIVKVRELLKKNIIGRVVFIRTDFSFFKKFNSKHRLFNLNLGGGALLDIGVYCLNFVQMILGKPLSIDGKALLGKTGSDESNAVTLTFKGVLAQVTSSIRYEGDREALVVGTKGRILLKQMWHRSLHLVVTTDKTEEILFTDTDYGLNYETEHFNELIRKGILDSPIMPLKDTFEVMSIMDDLRDKWGIIYPSER